MKNKPISKYIIRSLTVSGELCKHTCTVFDNGITHIEKLILSKKKRIYACKKVTSKFGINLFRETVAFKYLTLIKMANTTTHAMRENNVKREDILL